uniref:Uncharacterized protein n=1 Tax=Arundo donax TaxID=35708 RepID=A0A0A9BLK6_ARUDO
MNAETTAVLSRTPKTRQLILEL